jgi:hypothetical protein
MDHRLTQHLRALARPPRDHARFGDGLDYRVEVAADIARRRRCWALVYQQYLYKEFALPHPSGLWYGPHDNLDATTVFLVSKGGASDVATLTVVFDSPLGLPADGLYREQLAGLRAEGRRPSELISLGCAEDSTRRGSEALKHLFRLAFLTASELEGASDLIITVNPRHRAYYERYFAFEALGEELSYGKVGGAPAVLMRLRLEDAWRRSRELHGPRRGGLHDVFYDPDAVPVLLDLLRRERRPLTPGESYSYFESLGAPLRSANRMLKDGVAPMLCTV